MRQESLENFQPSVRRLPWLIVLLCVSVTAQSPAAADWAPNQLRIAGSDERVWVVAASKADGDKLPEVRFWFAAFDDKGSAPAIPEPSRYLPPVSGDPIVAASDKSALRVLFADFSLCRYESTRLPATDALYNAQSAQYPLAFAGDASKDVSWFLVDHAAVREATSQAASRPVKDAATSRPTLSADRLVLLRLERGFWTSIDVPQFIAGHENYRIAARDDSLHVFWHDKSAGRIDFASRTDNTWSDRSTAVLQKDIDRFWAGSTRTGPLLLIANPAAEPDQVTLSLAQPADGQWTISDPIRPGSKQLSVSRDHIEAAFAGDRLAIAFLEDDKIRFGWSDVSASPTIRLSTLSNAVPTDGSEQQGWRGLIETVVLLIVISFVLITRQQQIQTPAAVPKGYILASVWRRFIATLIDLSPALMITYLIYGDTLRPVFQMAIQSTSESIAPDAAMAAKMEKIRLLAIAIYGGWCLLLESFRHTTLGKRFMNCRVLSADGSAPTGRQILVRNIIRILIVGLGPSGILVTFMLMAMFSVNKQRLGDIMASTIVVQPAPPDIEDVSSKPFDDDISPDDR